MARHAELGRGETKDREERSEAMSKDRFGSGLRSVARQRSIWIALLLWMGLCVAYVELCHGKDPLNFTAKVLERTPAVQVISSSIALVFFVLEIGLVCLLTWGRAWPDLAQRAPERAIALRELLALWIYAAIVMLAGRYLGLHLFGEGIAMHLNGSLVGATRVQSPHEVYLWATYNGILFAAVPYVVFRVRGYSREQLNLKSANWKNDLLVILVVMAIGCFMDLPGGNFLRLHRQQTLE